MTNWTPEQVARFIAKNPPRSTPKTTPAASVTWNDVADEATHEKRESVLQHNCEAELTRRNIPFIHLSFRAREKAGWPDLVFPIAGFFVGAELKAKGKDAKDNQRSTLMSMKQHGGIVALIRSYYDFVKLLDNPQAMNGFGL